MKKEIVFSKEWFQKHQKKLLWLLNAPIIKIWFRWSLRIRKYDISLKEKINQITPNSFSYGGKRISKKKIQITTNFRTHDKYSKRLYFAFKPLWYLLHAFDWALMDRVEALTKLSFGFDTLTAYPNPSVETVSVDGYCSNDQATWAAARSGTASSSINDDITQGVFVQNRKVSASQWIVNRAFFLFDTSALTASASISAATFGVVPHDGAGSTLTDTMTLRIVSSTPASNTAIVVEDFDQIGSVVFASMLASDYVGTGSAYNIFTLDANGRANISKTGISKFGAVGSMDIDNVEPTGNNQVLCRYADYAGTSTDPALVVTYTVVTASGNFFQFL